MGVIKIHSSSSPTGARTPSNGLSWFYRLSNLITRQTLDQAGSGRYLRNRLQYLLYRLPHVFLLSLESDVRSSSDDVRRKDMKVVQLNFFLLFFITVWDHISTGELPKGNGVEDSKVRLDSWIPDPTKLNIRQKRQTETTTPKPKKPRPSNIFSLISVLLTETRDDANRAFSEIGTLFNGQFTNTTTPKVPTTTTTESPSSSPSDSDEDNEITTTTEPFRISRDEFFGILRSNVQGIMDLFGKEFRVAIKDSNQNVREFGRDLGVALRPYFYNNHRNNTKRNT